MPKQLTLILGFALAMLLSISSHASAMYTTYQAKIIKPDGTPLESTNVNFRFTILDPSGACILYTENFNTINMDGSGGLVYFSLGSGIKTFPASGSVNFSDVFNNYGTALSCAAGGSPSYTPAANDLRKIVMQFHDGSGWQTLPAMSINHVPYAMYAKNAASATTAINSTQLNGKTDLDFVQVTSIPTCSASQALQFNGASFGCVAVGSSGGSGLLSVSGTAPIAVTGSASAPVISISVASMSSNGYLTSADYATFSNKLNATSAAVISALGYTPADANVVGSSFSTVTTNVSNLSSSMTTLNSTVSSLSSSVGAIVSSQWNTSGTTINYMNGNVGIGTTDPGLALHIAGVNGLPVTSGTVQTGSFRIGNTVSQRVLDFGINGATSTAWMQSTTKNALSNANTLAINPNGGNVGIGTSAPSERLEVSGNLKFSSGAYLDSTTTLGANQNDLIIYSPDYLQINTGYGDVSFNRGLSVSGNIGLGGRGKKVVFGGLEDYMWVNNLTNNMEISSWGNIVLGPNSGGTVNPLMTLSNGNVGIGTANPSAKLELISGTTTIAPLKFTSGTLLSSAQSGAFEYDGFNFFITDSTNTRRTIATGSSQGTIDNASNINSSENITMTPVGSVIVSNTTASTNSSTGALIVNGGLGVAGNINTATNLNVSGSSTIDGSLKLSSMTSGSVLFAGVNGIITQDNSSFYWDGANKRLGIGTTLPLFKIEVSGTTVSDKKIGINGTQVVYLPDQSSSGFRGSLFVGNGGASMTHSAGSDGQYNTGVGIGALYSNTSGNENTATGNEALYSNTSGQDNTANGNYALYSNTTGSYNTANGYMALYSSITGYDNVANGYYTLYSNTSGSRNTAAGNYALYSNTSGDENTATGNSALESNQAGIRNTATGQYALSRNKTKAESTAVGYGSMRYADDVSATVTSSYNTAIGAYSLQGSITAANNTGVRNTALGHSALKNMTSGSSNTALGNNAGSAITTGSNNVILGSNDGSSIATSSNNIILSDGAGTERIRVNSSGNVGIGVTSPVARLSVSGGAIYTNHGGDWVNPGIQIGATGTGFYNAFGSLGFTIGGTQTMNMETTRVYVGSGSGANFPVSGTMSSPDISFYRSSASGLHSPSLNTLSVVTSGLERVRVTSMGAVGIGTTAPSVSFEVAGRSQIYTSLANVFAVTGKGTTYADATNGIATFYSEVTTAAGGNVIKAGSAYAPNTFVVKDSGNVGIGTTTPATALDVVGDIQYTGTITDVSDRRLKTNIAPLDSALSTVRKIKTYSYVMKDDPKARTEYGVMAQDMLGIIPNLVKNIDVRGEYYGVNYVGLIPWSIRAIQEVDRETQNLRRENTEIKRELASLKEKNEALEQKLEKILQALEQQKHHGEKK